MRETDIFNYAAVRSYPTYTISNLSAIGPFIFHFHPRPEAKFKFRLSAASDGKFTRKLANYKPRDNDDVISIALLIIKAETRLIPLRRGGASQKASLLLLLHLMN